MKQIKSKSIKNLNIGGERTTVGDCKRAQETVVGGEVVAAEERGDKEPCFDENRVN